MNQIAENLGAGENSEYQIDALNAISKALGGKHDSKYPAEALNEIAKTTNLKEVVLNHIKTTQSGVTEEKLEELTKLSTPELLQYSIHPEYVPNPDWDLSESLEKVMNRCGDGLFPTVMVTNDSYSRPSLVQGSVGKIGRHKEYVGFIDSKNGYTFYRKMLRFLCGGQYRGFVPTAWAAKPDGSYVTAGCEVTMNPSVTSAKPGKVTNLDPVFIEIRYVCKNNTTLHPGVNKNIALLCQLVVYRNTDFSIEDSDVINVTYTQSDQENLNWYNQDTDIIILNHTGFTPDTLKFSVLYGGTEDRIFNAGAVLTSLGLDITDTIVVSKDY